MPSQHCWARVSALFSAARVVMRYTLISCQDLIDSLLADFTVPHNNGNRCKRDYSLQSAVMVYSSKSFSKCLSTTSTWFIFSSLNVPLTARFL